MLRRSDELRAASFEPAKRFDSQLKARDSRLLVWKSCESHRLTGLQHNDILNRFRGQADLL